MNVFGQGFFLLNALFEAFFESTNFVDDLGQRSLLIGKHLVLFGNQLLDGRLLLPQGLGFEVDVVKGVHCHRPHV